MEVSDQALVNITTVALPLMCAGIGWVVKMLFDSRKESRDRHDLLKHCVEELGYLRDRTSRMELAQLLEHEPDGSLLLEEKYAAYTQGGHNGYIAEMYKRRKEHGHESSTSRDR